MGLARPVLAPGIRCFSVARHETAITGTSANVLDEMYSLYLRDPSSVPPSFVEFFTEIDAAQLPSSKSALPDVQTKEGFSIRDTLRILTLTRAFRSRGHLVAKIDPLGLAPIVTDLLHQDELDYQKYGFTKNDLDREFYVGTDVLPDKPVMKLREVLEVMQRSYCANIGVEYRHLLSKNQKDWIQQKVEDPNFLVVDAATKKRILRDLAHAEKFEQFLAFKHPAVKRFGLEGAETTIVGITSLLNRGAELDLDTVVIGMAHRGRLNVLGNIVEKPLEKIFQEFSPSSSPGAVQGTGDVKYHLGTSNTVTLHNGKKVHLSLTANPSHLEAVNPLVIGKTRAKQKYENDHQRSRKMGLLIHGDAAFAGQGVVAETLALNDLHNYTVGGSLHIIINNQIGFTTDPKSARSSPHCSDVAKMISAPIFHVNGDDPISVHAVCQLAIEFRMKFQSDVVVDVCCYRRHGHNESDEPAFTQPIMYKTIKKHASTFEQYGKKLVSEGTITEEELEDLKSSILAKYEAKYELIKVAQPNAPKDWLESRWKGIKGHWAETAATWSTNTDKEIIRQVGMALTRVPESFTLHKGISRLVERRQVMFETGEGFDWGTAEALAYGSLLLEGYDVRLSGQDCERGTFSHRHAVYVDQNTENTFVPLETLSASSSNTCGHFSVSNSNLSEFAALGFELGYSLESPKCLVIWEAQFGDFANGAQVILDNFISSGEQKWVRQSGITLLLPHGYEGQGPEHSSARLERYLQLCDDDPNVIPPPHLVHRQEHKINLQVVNLTTPANFFHCLRRQMYREWRKPLIVMSPKSLLRHKEVVSSLADFTSGSFQRLIPDSNPNIVSPHDVRKIIFCSGKVYFDLDQYRQEHNIRDQVIARVEQIAPFPFDLVRDELNKYPNAQVVWCQEESRNGGAWHYAHERLQTVMSAVGHSGRVTYAGRPPSAAPATGSLLVHNKETANMLAQAFRV